MTDAMMMEIGTLFAAMHKRKITAIIPARGGSQRLARKNIYPIWGHPMLSWAIKACKESRLISDVWVSSEDEEIRKIAAEYGAKTHNREEHLSEPHVFKMEAVRAAARHIHSKNAPDIIISLQANSPQITADMLDDAITVFIENDRNELMSVGTNMMQNAAFRIMKNSYVFQRDLSVKSGVYVCDLHDVHTIEDVNYVEGLEKREYSE